ncbi:LexA family protein [Neisseria sp. Ec49-e6-T10]|uniref:LexA family protein n=1 Tax=Neisseria sp. Ec49-e6-T10 TaxID=3140744 RepID=UPI003EC024DF
MKTIADIRHSNLLKLIDEYKSVTHFANHMGKSYAQISQLKNRSLNSTGKGKPRSVGDDLAREIEQKTGKPYGWMDISHEPNIQEIEIKKGLVPVISWVAAGSWCNIEDPFQPGDADLWLPCPVKHSINTFALRVTGLSMFNPLGKPSFEDGDIIFVDPLAVALNKSCVIVRIEDEKEATFKQLIIESGKRYLKPLNPDWPDKIIEVHSEATICGVVIGKWVEM